MPALPGITATLIILNELLVATVLIVAFALLVYITIQSWQSAVSRALAALLFSIVVVAGGDVLLGDAQRETTIQFLLRAQWLGIALVPAGYLHLADALLTRSGQIERRRRWLVVAAYALSLLVIWLGAGTDLLLRENPLQRPIPQLAGGPLFWPFTLYYAIACGACLWSTLRVRTLALTPTLRRRLGYLAAAVPGPAFAVFPYLTISPDAAAEPLPVLVIAAGTYAVALLATVVLVYSAAFQGSELPDRLIKQDFIRWILYGPFIGVTTVLFLRTVPFAARSLGLPAEVLLTFGVMVMTVTMPIFVSRIKPYLDRLVYTQDHDEIGFLRALPRSTFTRADLRSLLENTLVAICGALRVDTGFVAARDEQGNLTVKTIIGARRMVRQFVEEQPLAELATRLTVLPRVEPGASPPPEALLAAGEFTVLPLRNPDGMLIGALGVAAPHDALGTDTRRLIGALAHRMELALEAVTMQQQLFTALRSLDPELQSLRQLSTQLEQATPASLETMEADVALQPEFPQLVKDALGHYWGGPKLSESPLLELRAVRLRLSEHGGSATRALQSVLRQAIDNLRPDEQLDPSAQEWMLYKILDLRFLQGKRIRDIAERLAISESDLYRKQRVAVEEVARQLALIEETALDLPAERRV